ncbi:hypothetical protein C8Q78DRAFT_1018022 [Trametes maxima]|nr:hypothetical protein C8Q78DRAFT_1018022 [Trametes maxima]
MSFPRSICDTLVPAKRSAPSVFEPLRVSRSMAAEDPHNKNLLTETQSPPPVATSTRRRVNPESLAVRLGPELVKELESHVKPGVIEMPSFAIRQQIQMRFKVDRRHIYDWFHSKGLRVTKEDKRATVEQKTDAMRMQVRGTSAGPDYMRIYLTLPVIETYSSVYCSCSASCQSLP